MSELFWLANAQMARLEAFLSKTHGKPCVDERGGLREIIFLNRNGLRLRSPPAASLLHLSLAGSKPWPLPQ